VQKNKFTIYLFYTIMQHLFSLTFGQISSSVISDAPGSFTSKSSNKFCISSAFMIVNFNFIKSIRIMHVSKYSSGHFTSALVRHALFFLKGRGSYPTLHSTQATFAPN